MKFYDFRPAPSPTKVRIVIAEKGFDIPTESVNLRELEQQGELYRKKHMGATVPMLELDDGTCLTESLAISHYLDQLSPEPNLFGRDPKEQGLVLMWHDIATLEGYLGVQEFYRNSSDFFRDRALPGPEPYAQIPALVDRGRIRIRKFVTKLDQRLNESAYLACARYTYADIAAFVYLDFAKRVLKENPATEHANVIRWEAAIAKRAAVQVATG